MESKSYQNNDDYDIGILRVADVAKFLRCSQSWVSKNYQELGGVKIAGSILFPSRKEIYEYIFQQKKEMVGVRLSNQRSEVQKNRVLTKKGSSGSRSRAKERSKKSQINNNRNRHGLLGTTE